MLFSTGVLSHVTASQLRAELVSALHAFLLLLNCDENSIFGLLLDELALRSLLKGATRLGAKQTMQQVGAAHSVLVLAPRGMNTTAVR